MASKFKSSLSAGLIAAGAVAILAIYTGDKWLDPRYPAIIGAAAIFPLSVVMALLMNSEARRGAGRFAEIALTILSAAAIGVGIPATWTQPEVRIAALKQAAPLVDARAALDDPIGSVRRHACLQMLGDASLSGVLVDELLKRPRLATTCLGAAEPSVAMAGIASNLEDGWHKKLLTAAPPPHSDACLNARALAVLPLEKPRKQADLFDCSIRSGSAQKRICCADSLASISSGCAALAGSIDAQSLVDNGDAASLGALSFGESNSKREFSALADRVELQCPEMQSFSLKLACASRSWSAEPAGTQTFLSWLFDQHLECLSPEERESQASIDLICTELMGTLAESGTVGPELICANHLQAIQKRQVALAEIKGLSSEESEQLAARVISGSNQAKSNRLTLEQFTASAQGKLGAPSLDSYDEEQARAMMQRLRGGLQSPEQMAGKALGELRNSRKEFTEKFSNIAALRKAMEQKGEPAALEKFSEDAMSEQLEKRLEQMERARKRFESVSSSRAQ